MGHVVNPTLRTEYVTTVGLHFVLYAVHANRVVALLVMSFSRLDRRKSKVIVISETMYYFCCLLNLTLKGANKLGQHNYNVEHFPDKH